MYGWSRFWYRSYEKHQEYVAVIVDDLLIFSKNPAAILEPLEEVFGYELKGVGTPEYYNGADFSFTPEGFPLMSAKTYIKNMVDRVEN